MAQRRYQLKKNYEHERRLPGADQEELLKNYRADMSQNVASAMLKGTDKLGYKVSQEKDQEIPNEQETNISTWNQLEDTLKDLVEQEENPFSRREIGVSQKVQERRELNKCQWWTGGKNAHVVAMVS